MTTLSVPQTKRLLEFIDLFYAATKGKKSFSGDAGLVILGVRNRLKNYEVLTQEEADLLRWCIDLFWIVNPDYRDQHLEAAYKKFYGEWPVIPPWVTVVRGLPYE